MVGLPGTRPRLLGGFKNIVKNSSVPEADNDFTPDVYGDTYLNMELAIPRDSDGPEFASGTRLSRGKYGHLNVKASDNPILDT